MKNLVQALLILTIVVFPRASVAHDFWLLPEKFSISQNENLDIHFKVGHQGSEDGWGLRWDRVVSIREYHCNGVSDLARNLLPQSSLSEGKTSGSFQQIGTSIIGFESYHSVSVLGADKFNSYVNKEGLTLVEKVRKANQQMETAGVEIYSRKAKAIIQVGEVLTNNVLQPIGQTLEIVPMDHPYSDATQTQFRLKVMFRGKPLSGALVKLVDMSDPSVEAKSSITDAKGNTSFTFSKDRQWRLNTVWSVPLRGNERADFETYFSSLTFGY